MALHLLDMQAGFSKEYALYENRLPVTANLRPRHAASMACAALSVSIWFAVMI